MDYTHLSEFAVRPGALTLWRAELAAGAAWVTDERPFTSVHVRHCRDTDATDPRPGRGRWIGTIFEMDAPFDAAHWSETVRLWHARHEGLRTTLASCGDTELASYRDTEPERLICAAADVTVAAEPVPDVTESRHINEYLTDALELRLSPLRWPHCLLATVEHAETADFTVLVAADHSVMDAYSQAIVILELRALYAAVAQGEPVRESPTFGSSADFAQWERSMAAALTPECEPVRYWRRFLDGSGGMLPRFEPAITASSTAVSHRPQESVSRKLLSLTDLERVEQAVTERGHRLSVAVFTALAIAYRRTFGYISLRAIMPIATRPDLRWLESMGWFVNVVPIDITLAPDLDVDSALETTRTTLRRSKVANDATWTRVLELLGCTDRPRFGVSFLDIRVLPDYELVESLRGHTLRAESYSGDEVFFWIVRAADGLRLSTRFPASFPAVEMDRFLAEFTRAMLEFAHAPQPKVGIGPAIPSATQVLRGEGDTAVDPGSAPLAPARV
ncbi:condensation domain-containing protein [Nocardia sp. CDC153]|uniref:condensation domain-containing protein n=1 Tax=Nocardia sp. CDC153 TaxID=3112167 RepID=UPI002DBDF5DD|nr:condensation domain-containing protein [Nocardia sp. CDC153]MEC3956780.1 condensation domain-containing protein [Nocardia sp. CDC153]